MNAQEWTVLLEGPDHFLDVVYETIDAHVRRTGEEYGQGITGVSTKEVGDVDHEEESILHLFVLASVDRDEARELVDLALDRISDEHNMEMARQNVQVSIVDEP